jgi:hypothetical protein
MPQKAMNLVGNDQFLVIEMELAGATSAQSAAAMVKRKRLTLPPN